MFSLKKAVIRLGVLSYLNCFSLICLLMLVCSFHVLQTNIISNESVMILTLNDSVFIYFIAERRGRHAVNDPAVIVQCLITTVEK